MTTRIKANDKTRDIVLSKNINIIIEISKIISSIPNIVLKTPTFIYNHYF